MPGELDAALRSELRAWQEAGLARRLPELDGEEPASGDRRGDFRSNDCLGLSRDERVLVAARAALEEFGAGGRAARLLGGGSPLGARAEQAAAEWLGEEAALLFPSGWQANVGVVGALAGRGDALFSDERNHASLVDGCRLSRARLRIYRHLDMGELREQLALAKGARRRFVVTESVFGMDGDLAPLPELQEVCEGHDAWLVLDEAHAVGLLGAQGAGAWAASGRRGRDEGRLAARVITGGKALGVGGAFVVGSAALRDVLLHRARSFVYTTAPPPIVAGALVAAIDACRGAAAERSRALALARRLAAALGRPAPAAAVVPVPVADARRASALAGELAHAGFAVGAVRPPTVPEGGSRLRLVAHSFNDERGVDELARRIGAAIPALAATRTKEPSSDPPPSRLLAPAWFVVGTDTGVGKTVVSALLLRAALGRGPARYWKPVQTGADDDAATVRELARAPDSAIVPNEHRFPRPASPHEAAAHAGAAVDPSRLASRLAELRGLRIVELAGGLLVPYRLASRDSEERALAPFLQADWLTAERANLVLVARSGLGTLNHTLLTLEALRARRLEPAALFLVGERHASNAATLRELAGVTFLFEVPRFEPLAPAALDAWLAEHDVAALFGPQS
jgi:8-amino-7-oxononanoate synthase